MINTNWQWWVIYGSSLQYRVESDDLVCRSSGTSDKPCALSQYTTYSCAKINSTMNTVLAIRFSISLTVVIMMIYQLWSVARMTYVIGGTQATARFCCCFAAISNGVFGSNGNSAELPVQQLFQLVVLLLLLSPTFCQHKLSTYIILHITVFYARLPRAEHYKCPNVQSKNWLKHKLNNKFSRGLVARMLFQLL